MARAADSKSEGRRFESCLACTTAIVNNKHGPMFDVQKEFRFEAAHRIHGVPKTHKCYNLHGHNYLVTVACKGDLDDETGFVVDFADIAKAVKPIIQQMDHKVLCSIADEHLWGTCMKGWFDVYFVDGPTTAEGLAEHLYREIIADTQDLPVAWVRVQETPKAGATYQPE